MAKPNIEQLLLDLWHIEELDRDEFPALRKRIHHAFYYHDKQWQWLSMHDHDRLVYAVQWMHAVEATYWIDLMPYGESDIYD
jgi:hypothetical protein